MTINVDIGVFAHNERETIAEMLGDLARQSLFTQPDIRVKVFILANGCKDDTVEVARRCISAMAQPHLFEVVDIPQGGKSRTWNRFVHQIAAKDANILILCDADIRLPKLDALEALLAFMGAHPDVVASSSVPIKDIDYYPQKLGLVRRLISAGGGTLMNARHAICGQLYALRAQQARAISLPVGLPVEDGFVRHAVITQLFSGGMRRDLIDQDPGVSHVYESESKILSLIQHQVRIVIGGAVNAAIFAHLDNLLRSGGPTAVARELESAASNDIWLSNVLKAELPNPTFGWVPWPFLTSRAKTFLQKKRFTLKGLAITSLGLGFDFVVFVLAQWKMARGTGAGHW